MSLDPLGLLNFSSPLRAAQVRSLLRVSLTSECGETWIQDRYELLGGDISSYRGQQGTFDWAKLDNLNIGEKPYYLVFEYMYQKYMQSGNLDSKINFGKMLSKLGCVKGTKKINGKMTVVYVGIRSSYKPEVVNDDIDFVNDD